MRKRVLFVCTCVLAAAAYGQLKAAAADPSQAQKLVDARVAHYKQIGKAAKAIHDELGNSQPQLTNVVTNASVIESLAKQIPTWFPVGTGPQPGVKTEALPAIWQQTAMFHQRGGNLAAAAHELEEVAASGNVQATRAAAQNLGSACKACHDTFREKK